MEKFGQIVVGSPGSGKSTYCYAAQGFIRSNGRSCEIINLDPANETMKYSPAIDIRELVDLAKVAEEMNLGPNGSLLYCIEYLDVNVDWLFDKIRQISCDYLIFDLPGQVELYTHCNSLQSIIHSLSHFGLRLASVHMIDSLNCCDSYRFVSCCLLSLMSMLRLELPHTNVITKWDLVSNSDSTLELIMNSGFFTSDIDLSLLVENLAVTAKNNKFDRLNHAICDLVEEFCLVSFCTLSLVDDRQADDDGIEQILKRIDISLGYVCT